MDYQQHQCDKMPKTGVLIYFDEEESQREDATWQLTIMREATEEDLYNGGLYEYVGETIWRTCIEITHCPFCGASLYDEEHELDDDYGLFYHFGDGKLG